MKASLNSKHNILVIGAAVVDMIVHVNNLPKKAEDVYGRHESTIIGGCAYNVQQVIQHFGLSNTLFTPVGNGPYAQLIRDELTKKEIPILVEDEDNDNGWNISFVEHDGERTFLTIPGIETNWNDKWFDCINLSEYDFIYVSGYELEGTSGEIIVNRIKDKKAPHAKVIFDPGPRATFIDDTVLEEILTAGTIIHCNQSELMALVPNQSVEEAAKQLHDMTKEAVIITLGGEGTYFRDKSTSGYVPTEKVQVVDTIGAGDSHTGAFISGLAGGLTIDEACRLGNEVSAKVVQQTGGTFIG